MKGNEGNANRTTALLVAVLLGAVCATMVATVHSANLRALLSTHGFLHTAILQRFPSETLPPENPFFAGEPVCYYWFFHWLASWPVRLIGMDPLHAFEAIILGGFFAISCAALFLGRALYRSLRAGVVIALFALVGGNPLGPVIWVARGISQGPQVFRPDPEAMFGSYIYMSQVGARLYGPNLPYFFNITSRPLALSLILPMVYLAYRVTRRPSGANVLALAVTTAACTAISPIFGMGAGGALAAGLAAVAVWHRRSRPAEEVRAVPHPGWACAALIGGPLIAAPSYYHLFLISEGGHYLALFTPMGLKLAAAVVIGAGPLLLLAFLGRRAAASPDRAFQSALILAALVLLIPSAVYYLAVDNACNLFQTAIVILAVPAAGIIAPRRRHPHAADDPVRARSAMRFVPLLFLPAFVLIVHAYTGRNPIALGFESKQLQRLPADSPRSRMYAWIRERTEPEAIFVVDPRVKVALQGNVDELPALTGRVLLVGCENYLTTPYPDYQRRFALAVQMIEGEELSAEHARWLQRFRRPIYVVGDEALGASLDTLAGHYGAALFESEGVGLFLWTPPEPAGAGATP